VVHARFLQEHSPEGSAASRFDIHGIAVPYPGEDVCGDGWEAEWHDEICTILVVDGLGHGLMASDASDAAVLTFRESARLAPGMIVREIDGRLRSTRGAVGAVARLDLAKREVVYAGVGNISALIESPESSRRLVSLNGTLGGHVHKYQEFTYPFPEGSLLVLNSDGLTTHWTLADYPGLVSQSPPLIAGTLYRDNSRHRDDATVVVVRERA
jgi:hypothetical protein